ncbi:NADP-dependent isocitrate dehydrogenase [Endozoicomonas euniceicola]|uniref:Isocitrate dehydrogenase (NADP(+)) n=1 Tax=Endozoicomonas euniceicola TaxID=1234143 RepID=A0ABY6H1C5_9GAMM|nr:NADP-dependent isocitrate dehydrogenase [Endozoicomonas euniceicola]UYM18876.1 NADP-dependent isocitrate dehydrogenase [Endozoicomonas euniceicola]
MHYQHITTPANAEQITINPDQSLYVPDNPIITFIQGDGVGADITPVTLKVVDAAVKQAYGESRKIGWMEVFNGEKAAELYDGDWFPQETLHALRKHVVALKGPLTTPLGGGFRSLNIALRQEMDLFVNMRPVQWVAGVPSPVTHPEKVNMVVFRENSEDIYTGIEWKAGSLQSEQLMAFLQQEMGVSRIRFTEQCALGIKPISEQGCKRLIRHAIQYALIHQRRSVTLVHKGNIMKFTEGAFRQWGFQLAQEEFGAKPHNHRRELVIDNNGHPLIIKDAIADSMLQYILLQPEQFDVIATMNQNGDFIADALSAQVGGSAIVPGANLNNELAIFEPTHGTAQTIAGKDIMNPCSMLLCAELMLAHIGWKEAAGLIHKGIEETIQGKIVTYDFARMIAGAREVSCSEFGETVIQNMSASKSQLRLL